MTDNVKDPAFLFYSAQFMQMVSDLTMEERGMFITMLCAQHQHGELKEKTIRLSVGKPSDDVMDKFSLTENGTMVNLWLAELMDKRKFYTESRRQNGRKGGRPAKNDVKIEENNLKETISLPYEEPTDIHTVNVNVNVNKDINNKGVQGENEKAPKIIPPTQPPHKDVHDPQTGQFVNTKTIDVEKLVPDPKTYKAMPEEYNILLMNLGWSTDTLSKIYHAWVNSYKSREDAVPVNQSQAKALFKKYCYHTSANHPDLRAKKSADQKKEIIYS